MNRPVVRLTIEQDCDCENPLDDRYGCEVKLLDFRRRDGNASVDDYHDWSAKEKCYIPKLGLRAKLKAGTAIRLDYFEHGMSSWFRTNGGRDLPFDPGGWDTSKCAGILWWKGKPNDLGKTPKERADNLDTWRESYNSWLTGDCYWFSIEPVEYTKYSDSCGGLLGYDNPCEMIAHDCNLPEKLIIIASGDGADFVERFTWREDITVYSERDWRDELEEREAQEARDDAEEDGSEWEGVA
jgi:hypothetical protein